MRDLHPRQLHEAACRPSGARGTCRRRPAGRTGGRGPPAARAAACVGLELAGDLGGQQLPPGAQDVVARPGPRCITLTRTRSPLLDPRLVDARLPCAAGDAQGGKDEEGLGPARCAVPAGVAGADRRASSRRPRPRRKTARLAARKSLLVPPTKTTGRPAQLLLVHRPRCSRCSSTPGAPPRRAGRAPGAPTGNSRPWVKTAQSRRAPSGPGSRRPGGRATARRTRRPRTGGCRSAGGRSAPGRPPRSSRAFAPPAPTAFGLTRTSLRPSPSTSAITTGEGPTCGGHVSELWLRQKREAEPVLEERRPRRVEDGQALVRPGARSPAGGPRRPPPPGALPDGAAPTASRARPRRPAAARRHGPTGAATGRGRDSPRGRRGRQARRGAAGLGLRAPGRLVAVRRALALRARHPAVDLVAEGEDDLAPFPARGGGRAGRRASPSAGRCARPSPGGGRSPSSRSVAPARPRMLALIDEGGV